MTLTTIAFIVLAASSVSPQSDSPGVIPYNSSLIGACGLGIEFSDLVDPAGESIDFLDPATFESIDSLICGVYLLGVANAVKHLSEVDFLLEAVGSPNVAEMMGERIQRYRCLPPAREGLGNASTGVTADAIDEIRRAYLAYIFSHPNEEDSFAVASVLSSMEEYFPCSPAN